MNGYVSKPTESILHTVHPLAEVSRGRESGPPPVEDQTPADFPVGFFPGTKQRWKRSLGKWVYPAMNALKWGFVERKLATAGIEVKTSTPSPTSLSLGQKGFSIEIFLDRIRRVIGPGRTVVAYGCGLGYEVFPIVRYLRPKAVIGYEYFNYRKSWDHVAECVKRASGIPVAFVQADLRKPVHPAHDPADVVFSYTVLEHLRDMDQSFRFLRPLVRTGGWFAAQWGPMWYSFGGDHIAPELGEDAGFEHVRLTPSDYLSFYKAHPRNRDAVARGEPTWLELGLHNFARYEEYVAAITRHFGTIQNLHWQLSPEALRWRNRRPQDWRALLTADPTLTPLDLVLQGAAAVAGPIP